MKKLLQAQSPARLISLGFAAVILIGSVLLILPCSVREGVELKYRFSVYFDKRSLRNRADSC